MRLRSILCLLVASATVLPAQTKTKKDLYDTTALRTLYITFSSSTWYSTMVSNRSKGTYLQGNLVVDGSLYQQIGVRISGNNSYDGTTSQKKSLSIKMDEFIANQNLLGYESINLHNGYNDPSLMREVLGYEVLRNYMPAPKANWMKVYINNTYWGLYVNIQQVDKNFISDHFKGSGGNRYLASPPATAGKGNSTLKWLGTTLQSYKDAYDLKSSSAATNKPWEDVRALCNAFGNSTALATDLPKLFDVDLMLWYLAHYNLVANLNGYNDRGLDYYLYHDKEHGVIAALPWDMAGAFGASSGQKVADATKQSPFLSEKSTALPALGKLWGVPEWRSRYIHHMRTISSENFNWTKLSPKVTTYAKLIDASVKADTKKLYTYTNFTDNVTKQVAVNSGTYAKNVPGLKQLVDARLTYLASLADFKAAVPTVSAVAVSPVDPAPKATVQITAKVTASAAIGTVLMHYRTQGGWLNLQMYDDGAHGDGSAGDGTYGATVPSTVHTPGAVVDYYVGAQMASTAGGAVAYHPTYASRNSSRYVTKWAVGTSPISINEVMAINNTVAVDAAGEYDDWLELYNSTSKAVTIGGMYLTDDVGKPTKFKIAAGTIINAKSTMIIWCDEDGSQGATHANFKLSGSGEEIILFDTDGITRVSSIKFGQQVADQSIGWLFDGVQTTLVAYKKFGAGVGRGSTPNGVNAPAGGPREYYPVDNAKMRLFIQWAGLANLGSINAISTLGGKPNSAVLLWFASKPGELHIGNGLHVMLSGPLSGPYVLPTYSQGQAVAVLTVPNQANLVGLKFYMQVAGDDKTGFTVSNGAEVTVVK